MNDRDQRRHDRLVRVQTFGKTNLGDFAPNGLVATKLAALDQNLTAIEAAKAEQTPTRVSKTTLLDALRSDFKSIARTARAIEDAGETGFARLYAVPLPLTEAAVRTHASAVLARLEDATDDSAAVKTAKAALRAKFIHYELAADFVADLRADFTALTQTATYNENETLQGVESTAQLDRLLGEGTALVQQLDAAVRNRYERQPEKLAAWASASHVENLGRRSKATANTTVTVPAATSATSATTTTPATAASS